MALPNPDDTIVAVSSAPGTGMRAIIRLSGPRSWPVVQELVLHLQTTPQPGQVMPVLLSYPGSSAGIPADLYWSSAPRSYTSQDMVEIHTLGAPPIVEVLVQEILNRGVRAAGPGEFTLRAFLTGKLDLPRAEAVHDVILANQDADLISALQQLAGGVSRPLAALREDLLNLLADLEAGLDFVEEDIEFVSSAETLTRLASAMAQLQNMRRQMQDRGVSGRLPRVVLVGSANAGKSTLFNALIGRPAAIMSPIPGTTRDYLTTIWHLGEFRVEIVDTAGWQLTQDEIDAQSQKLGRDQLREAEVVLWCIPGHESRERVVAEQLASLTNGTILSIRTMSDRLVSSHSEMVLFGDELHCSGLTGLGIPQLRERIVQELQHHRQKSSTPSQSRCRHHLDIALRALQQAHEHARESDPQELLALALREALDQIGEMTGAIATNDLLDRIFSRFCIGK